MSHGVGGSLFSDPVGLIRPVAAGGGGGGQIIGTAVLKYTSLTDPPAPQFEVDVDALRMALRGDADFTAAVDDPLRLLIRGDANFTMAAETAMRMELFADTNFTENVSRLHFTTSQILATKDSWVDVTVGCVGGGTNRNGTDLQSEGIVATRKDPIFGWDVTGFPSNATVLSATVRLQQINAPVTSGTSTLNTIAAANEGWSESTVVCNNIPAVVASAGTFSNAASGAKTITLNATGRSALQTAMGSTSFSLRQTVGGLVTNHSYESADQGTNDSLGPRLSIVFTVPVT